MLRRSWIVSGALLAVPALTAVIAGCPGTGASPYSPFAVPTVLPSPLLGNGTLTMSLDGRQVHFERAVYFAPGGGHVGIRPDQISPEQRQDIFPNEVGALGTDFRLELPSGDAGLIPADTGKATLTLIDRRSEPAVTYKGPVTVFLQEAGKQRGYPILGTFSGTLTAEGGRHLTVTDGQFHGYLATDL